MKRIHVEIERSSRSKRGEEVCGDDFKVKRLAGEDRYIAVLSDGLGSGFKASLLSTMTTAMALRFVSDNMEIVRSSEIIMDTLPVCAVRKISYSTFTIADTYVNGHTRMVEMDNPPYIHLRGAEEVTHEKQTLASAKHPERKLLVSNFDALPGDRLIFFSDGVTQAGLGHPGHKFGWRREGCLEYLRAQLRREPDVSALELAARVVAEACRQDPAKTAADDTTCVVIYFREPRNLLLLTGPPFKSDKDAEFARYLADFDGKKVICGGTTANIVSRELDRQVKVQLPKVRERLPAAAEMAGVDLVTEGILTLTETARVLEAPAPPLDTPGPALRLFELLHNSDVIEFLVGTRINEAHQDPSLPIDLEIRRNIVKRIVRCLEERYLKECEIRYI